MQHTTSLYLSLGLLTVFFSSLVRRTDAASDALSQTYCSDQNTGSNSDAKYWTWQSNGWCHDQCLQDYAFAVVQGNNCWCSNYAPADQSDVSDCSTDCPGYPEEKCGNTDKGLFGYVALTKSPSGTQGSSQASSTVSTPASSSAAPSSAAPSSTKPETTSAAQSSAKPSSSAAQTTLQTSSTRQASSSRQVSSSSFSPTPITSVQTLTVSGVVVTQTVTSLSSAPAALHESEKKSSSAGTIAGAVIGGIAGLALIGALIFFLLRRHRKQKNDGEETGDSSNRTSRSPPRRNTSTLSRTGLLKSEKEPLPPVITTNRSSRNLDLNFDHESISPISMERRNSRPLFYDQRLNPTALMDLDNGSHSSLVTMEDNRDYTRTLNIRNPDPDPHH